MSASSAAASSSSSGTSSASSSQGTASSTGSDRPVVLLDDDLPETVAGEEGTMNQDEEENGVVVEVMRAGGENEDCSVSSVGSGAADDEDKAADADGPAETNDAGAPSFDGGEEEGVEDDDNDGGGGLGGEEGGNADEYYHLYTSDQAAPHEPEAIVAEAKGKAHQSDVQPDSAASTMDGRRSPEATTSVAEGAESALREITDSSSKPALVETARLPLPPSSPIPIAPKTAPVLPTPSSAPLRRSLPPPPPVAASDRCSSSEIVDEIIPATAAAIVAAPNLLKTPPGWSRSKNRQASSPRPPTPSTTSALSRDQVRKSEHRKSRIAVRVSLGALMFGLFCTFVYMGHLYVCTLVAVIELLLFRELVRVRYNAHFDTVQNRIPFFRTTQWCWFVLSILYTYGDFVYDVIQSNPRMHHLNRYLQYLSTISFILYSGVLVLTISTLQPGYIKFQMNQLCWTTLVICLTVGQLKYVFHNVFNGLIWFCLPCCLVFTNDIAAYGAGMTWGRKFIQRPFLALSPNKTWEGFIGGWAVTMITSWYLAKALAQYSWMICPTNRFTTEIHAPLSCVPDPIFLEAQSYFPSQIFELLPDFVVKQIPGIVDVCLVKSPDSSLPAFLASAASAAVSGASASAGLDAHSSLLSSASSSAAFASSLPSSAATGGVSASAAGEFLTPCVSGDPNQVHHHFELTMRNHYPIQVHALWLGLFASLVAPFGGFLASAMKRAYGIKDFDSLIPGHGGVMDRMDCQFLMALCTWVHYNTFVKLATVSVPRLTYLYGMLSDREKVEFLRSIAAGPKIKIRYEDFALANIPNSLSHGSFSTGETVK